MLERKQKPLRQHVLVQQCSRQLPPLSKGPDTLRGGDLWPSFGCKEIQ